MFEKLHAIAEERFASGLGGIFAEEPEEVGWVVAMEVELAVQRDFVTISGLRGAAHGEEALVSVDIFSTAVAADDTEAFSGGDKVGAEGIGEGGEGGKIGVLVPEEDGAVACEITFQ